MRKQFSDKLQQNRIQKPVQPLGWSAFLRKYLTVKSRKSSIVDVWLGSKYPPAYFIKSLEGFFQHCVKSVQIRSFFWSIFSCIRTEYRKMRTRKNSIFGHFSRSVGFGQLQVIFSQQPVISEICDARFEMEHSLPFWLKFVSTVYILTSLFHSYIAYQEIDNHNKEHVSHSLPNELHNLQNDFSAKQSQEHEHDAKVGF